MPPRDLTPFQFGDPALSSQEAYAACGPAAAVAFARYHGRNPTLREALDLAKQVGWTAGGGMNGAGNQLRLLQRMGIPARLESGVNREKIIRDVQGGNPVTVSSAAHYFVLNDYDPKTGRFYVGSSGRALKAGGEWMTLERMDAVSRQIAGGGLNGVLYLDNPATPTPSIAAGGAPAGAGGPPGGDGGDDETVQERQDREYGQIQSEQTASPPTVRAGGEQNVNAEQVLTDLYREKGEPLSTVWLRKEGEDEVANSGEPGGQRTYRYTFRDGSYVDVLKPSTGAPGQVVGGTALRQSAQATPRGGPISEFKPVPGSNGRTLYNERTGQTIAVPAGTTDRAPYRFRGEDGGQYEWDGSRLTTIIAPPAQEAKEPETRVVGNQWVQLNPDGTTRVIFSAPQGWTIRESADGGTIAINPQTLETRILEAGKGPGLITQNLDKPFLGVQPGPGEAMTPVPNPAYRPPQVQAAQELYDSIDQIQGMIEQRRMTPTEGGAYMRALVEAHQAAVRGTTPFQEAQHRDQEARLRGDIGRGVLNERLAKGTQAMQDITKSLGTATKPFTFGPRGITGAAEDVVNRLGGGPEVGTAAQSLLLGAMPQNMQPKGPGPLVTGLEQGLPGQMPANLMLAYLAAKEADERRGAAQGATQLADVASARGV